MRRLGFLAACLLLAPVSLKAESLEQLLVRKGVLTRGEVANTQSDSSRSKLYWNDGTRFEFPDTGFTARLNTLVQARYTFVDNDDESGLRNRSTFENPRARLMLSGTALNEEFYYVLEGEFLAPFDEFPSAYESGSESRSPALKDAYIEWRPCPEYQLRMGQFRPAFSRQFNTNLNQLQFADRAEATRDLAFDRSQGAQAAYDFPKDWGNVSAAIFNGASKFEGTQHVSTGETTNASGVDTKHVGVIAARINPMGKMNAYEEGDIDHTEKLALSFGASGLYGEGNNSVVNSTENDTAVFGGAGDINAKYRGWSLHSEFLFNKFRPYGGFNDFAGPGDHYRHKGGYVQTGYFVMPKKLEFALRYGIVECDEGRGTAGICPGNDYVHQGSATANYFFWRHNLKAQLGYEFINEDRTDVNEGQFNQNKWIFQVGGFF